MKHTIIAFILLLNCSCNNQQESITKDYADKVLDFVIANHDNKSIALDDLYDSTIEHIPEDKDETILLAERLKARGFEQTEWGRGNYPPCGERIIVTTLKKGDCECSVSKIYYATTSENVFVMKENVRCAKIAK